MELHFFALNGSLILSKCEITRRDSLRGDTVKVARLIKINNNIFFYSAIPTVPWLSVLLTVTLREATIVARR